MATRADRIFTILDRCKDKRLAVKEIRKRLARAEGVLISDLSSTTISATVASENKYRTEQGISKRFKTFGDGESFGYISIIEASPPEYGKKQILDNYEANIPKIIEEANKQIKKKLYSAIRNMSWREFESSFLIQVLEALGFNAIEITRKTKDGGVDAYCSYARGLVKSEALVSAKHWGQDCPNRQFMTHLI